MLHMTLSQMQQAQQNARLLDDAARRLNVPREQVPDKLRDMVEELAFIQQIRRGEISDVCFSMRIKGKKRRYEVMNGVTREISRTSTV